MAAGYDGGGAYMVGNSIGMGAYSPTATDGPWVDVVCTPVEVTPTTGAATGTVTSATAGTTVTMFAISGSGAAVNATVTVTGAGWTANNFVGDLLVLTGGTGAGQTAMILSNTSTVITIEGTWPVTTPTSSTTFEIETPINGSTFSSTEAQPPGATQYAYDAGTSVFYVNFNDDPFVGVGLEALALSQNTTGDPTFSVDGCSFAPNIHNFPTSGVTVSGSSAAMRYNATSNLTGSALFVANGNGLFLSNNVTLPAGAAAEVATAVRVLGGVTGFSLGGSVFATGNYVTAATATDNAFIQVDGAGVAALTANYVSGSNYGVRAGPESSVYSGGNTWASQANYGITFSVGYPVGFYPNGVLIEDGDVCNSTGSGCFNIPGGKAALQQDAVTGSGNAAVITATAGGTVDIQVLPTATASTATNEILVDGTGYSWATYATAGESIASNVGTTVFGPTVTQQDFQSGITVPEGQKISFDVAGNTYCYETSANGSLKCIATQSGQVIVFDGYSYVQLNVNATPELRANATDVLFYEPWEMLNSTNTPVIYADQSGNVTLDAGGTLAVCSGNSSCAVVQANGTSASTPTLQNTAGPMVLMSESGATGVGTFLDNYGTTMTTGSLLEIGNNGTQAYALSGYGHPLYTYTSHIPTVSVGSGTAAFVASSNAAGVGTTTLSFTMPSAAIGNMGVAAISVASSAGTATATSLGISGCTTGWTEIGSEANSTPTIITTLWVCPYVSSASTVTVTISGSAFNSVAAFGAYSGVNSFVVANAVVASGTSAVPTISLSTTVANSFVVAALGDSSVSTGQTANTGNLRQTQAGSANVEVGLVDNTSASTGTVTDAVNATSSAWSAVAVELLPGGQSPLGAISHVTYGGSDAKFTVQLETGPVTWTENANNQSLFTVTLANAYSGAGANVWGSACQFIGAGTTPAAQNSTWYGLPFVGVVTGARTFNVYQQIGGSTATPPANTYLNFMCETDGLSATY